MSKQVTMSLKFIALLRTRNNSNFTCHSFIHSQPASRCDQLRNWSTHGWGVRLCFSGLLAESVSFPRRCARRYLFGCHTWLLFFGSVQLIPVTRKLKTSFTWIKTRSSTIARLPGSKYVRTVQKNWHWHHAYSHSRSSDAACDFFLEHWRKISTKRQPTKSEARKIYFNLPLRYVSWLNWGQNETETTRQPPHSSFHPKINKTKTRNRSNREREDPRI